MTLPDRHSNKRHEEPRGNPPQRLRWPGDPRETRNPAQGVAIIAHFASCKHLENCGGGEALLPTMHRADLFLPLPAGDIHLWFSPYGESREPPPIARC